MTCTYCGKRLDEIHKDKFVGYDLQKNEEKRFCSANHLKKWMTGKITWMCVSLVLGVIIAVGLFSEMGGTAITLLFLPYMIRQVRHSLGEMFNGGTFGEFVVFAIVLLGTITVVYPVYKLYQEITNYTHIKSKYSL